MGIFACFYRKFSAVGSRFSPSCGGWLLAGSVVVLTRRMPRAPHFLPYREPRAPISAALIHGATLNGIPDSTQVYSD